MASSDDESAPHTSDELSPTEKKQDHPRLITCVIKKENAEKLSLPDIHSKTPETQTANGPSMRPRLWTSERHLTRSKEPTTPRLSSLRKEVMDRVEEWLQENASNSLKLSVDRAEEPQFDSDMSDEETNTPNMDINFENSHVDDNMDYKALSAKVKEATELLREEHEVLKELVKDSEATYRDSEDTRKLCERLESENAILRKRLIKKNYENSELRVQFDALIAVTRKKKEKERESRMKGSSLMKPTGAGTTKSNEKVSYLRSLSESAKSAPNVFQRENVDASLDENRKTGSLRENGLKSSAPLTSKVRDKPDDEKSYLRGLFQRSKSAFSVMQRDPVDTLSDVNRKNSMMKWLDDTIPSLGEEVSDEAQRIKDLLASNKSDMHRLVGKDDRQQLRTRSMRDLLP